MQMNSRDAGDERISTRLECVRLPVTSAFIVFLDMQLFVGGSRLVFYFNLAASGLKPKRRPCSLNRIHIRVDISPSVETALRPSLFISHSESSLRYINPRGSTPPLSFSTFRLQG